MVSDAPNRFDRIVSILIQLQSKKTVRAQELAERFDVSLRTIYRDIRSLNTAGIPIIGEAGTGYSMMEGYRLPPVMFTRQEAGSFVAAEKLMQHFTDRNLLKHFESAMYKIKSVLRGSEKEWVETLDSYISIHAAQKAFNEKIPQALELLFESVARKKQVILDYQAIRNHGLTRRQVEVVGIFHENRYWYILGYCHLRQDYRQFRIDRIKGIMRSDKEYSRTHETVEEIRARNRQAHSVTVRMEVKSDIVEYLKYDRDAYGFISEKPIDDVHVELIFKTHSGGEGFARWFLMFADHARILEPESLRLRVAEILENAIRKLEQ